MLLLSSVDRVSVALLLKRYGMELVLISPQEVIPGSFWGESEAGLKLGIADNGPGLPPRARENLFVAFEGSAKAGGTGLGLAIARELVMAHGGSLSYTPLDPGTRFDISFPASIRVD